MGQQQRDSVRKGLVQSLAMVVALFGGGGAVRSPEAWAPGAINGKGTPDLAKARFRGKLQRAKWRKMRG